MSLMSVPQAADRLGVSPARVRQRIEAGTLIADKVGGRWLVDLGASPPAPGQPGRPVSAPSVWWSIAAADAVLAATDPELAARGLRIRMMAAASGLAAPNRSGAVIDVRAGAMKLSRSSRIRAVQRVADAVEDHDHEALLLWLGARAARHLYVAAPADLADLRTDPRLVLSGVSHPASGMEDPRMVEAYVDAADLDALNADYWLERPTVDERPNVLLHASPVRPPAIGPPLLAADLAEHRDPRAVSRAHELIGGWIDSLLRPDRSTEPS